MKPCNSGNKSFPRKESMVTSLRKIMVITLDICSVKKVREMIINHGIAEKLLLNKLQEKESTTVAHSKHSVMTT